MKKKLAKKPQKPSKECIKNKIRDFIYDIDWFFDTRYWEGVFRYPDIDKI